MYVTTGEALVDLIEDGDGRYRACLGGSVCNWARAVARQGRPVRYLNALSVDAFGDRFAERLRADGVDLGGAARSACPTSLAVVSLDADGAPGYVFHREGVADRDGSADELIARLPGRVDLVHTGGLALMPADWPRTRAVVEAARERGAVVSVDANLRPMVVGPDAGRRAAYRESVRDALGEADVVKLSDEDAVSLGWSADDPDRLASELLRSWPRLRLIAITLGARGALLSHRSARARLPAPAGVRVVDTVGAGDCFQAALLVWLDRAGRLRPRALERLSADELARALRHAMAAAALNVQQQGCQPPTWDDTCAMAARC